MLLDELLGDETSSTYRIRVASVSLTLCTPAGAAD